MYLCRHVVACLPTTNKQIGKVESARKLKTVSNHLNIQTYVFSCVVLFW